MAGRAFLRCYCIRSRLLRSHHQITPRNEGYLEQQLDLRIIYICNLHMSVALRTVSKRNGYLLRARCVESYQILLKYVLVWLKCLLPPRDYLDLNLRDISYSNLAFHLHVFRLRAKPPILSCSAKLDYKSTAESIRWYACCPHDLTI